MPLTRVLGVCNMDQAKGGADLSVCYSCPGGQHSGRGATKCIKDADKPPPATIHTPTISITKIHPNGQQYPARVLSGYAKLFSFIAKKDTSYLLDTELQDTAASLPDSIMRLYDTDLTTVLAENDDDPRQGQGRDSYIQWTCPHNGKFYISVSGVKGVSGTFTLSVKAEDGVHGGASGNPCKGGNTMSEAEATIDFTPDGDYKDDELCKWNIQCPKRSDKVSLVVSALDTESQYDWVTLYDDQRTKHTKKDRPLATMSGALSDLPQTHFVSKGPMMTVQFDSDGTVGKGGFIAKYKCGPAPPPAPKKPHGTRPPPPAVKILPKHHGSACVSTGSCENLKHKYGGWPVSNTGKTGGVCGESDNGFALGLRSCFGDDDKEIDGWSHAEYICFEAGARLCTASVWSADACSKHGWHVSVKGKQARCSKDRSNIAVRCCADIAKHQRHHAKCDPFANTHRNKCSSALTCADLRSRGGRGSWPSGRGDSAVCGESDDWGTGPSKCYGKKQDHIGWKQARQICGRAGARLCTIEELEADETRNTGCSHDSAMIWSADSIGCPSGQHVVVKGSSALSEFKEVPCRKDTAGAAVRCCADTIATRPCKYSKKSTWLLFNTLRQNGLH
jgi:hypothetical protein